MDRVYFDSVPTLVEMCAYKCNEKFPDRKWQNENIPREMIEKLRTIHEQCWYFTFEGKRDKLMHSGKYVDLEKEGVHTWFYRNGHLYMEGEWRNGKKENVHKEWYRSPNGERGQIKIMGKWKNGKEEGVHREWYSSQFGERGQLCIEGMWKNGKRNGMIRRWDENGQLEYECKWINDKPSLQGYM